MMRKFCENYCLRLRLEDAGRLLVPMLFLLLSCVASQSSATSIEFNNTGGSTATDGLHFYIDDTTHIQVRRLDNTGQVYAPGELPPSLSLDNGVFLRANGNVYGPAHEVIPFSPAGGMYNTFSITAATPANPSSSGVQQTATGSFGITAGPQVSVVWKYTTPLDFLTAEVTLTIPAGYAVSAANPVRYYHVFDTFLGGSDTGCGVKFTDSNGKQVMGTYSSPDGTTCPSSTSLPAGVSITESFRERSGLPFSSYCAVLWVDFYENGGANCSVLQTAPMSNTIVTAHDDTGIGIEYDFSAAGTYTFSYDFVVGSGVVPPYDHLEIQHDGTTTLCPDNVTVLACTSSTIPCPPLSRVNTGTLTGSITTSPAAPAITKAPTTFSLGSAGSTALVALQGAAPGGIYTLGTSGLSSVPLNGTKCWNTATNTASCFFIVTNTPCVSNFECMETSATYNNRVTTPAARNPLYTKLPGTDFKFDVVALQSSGAIASGYTATQNVTVELFDDSVVPQPLCSAYSSPVASQAITFAAADAGRKTVANNFNLAKAYRKLRCRVTDTNLTPTVYGCSSDDFTVRPQSFTIVTSTNASADLAGTSVSATPAIKAGATFSLTANTGTVGYDGMPKINAANLEWLGAPVGGRPSPGTGTLQGAFSIAATSASGNGATGSAFTYDEAGYFRFKALGVYDDTFTTYSSDLVNNDCIQNSTSNTLVGGKYGCNFGNTAVTNHFGRFIPDHFKHTVLPIVNRTDPAAAPLPALVCNPVSIFTYMGEPLTAHFTLTAENATGTTTQNYSGNFAKFNLGAPNNFNLRARNSAGLAEFTGRLTPIASTGTWGSGIAPDTTLQFSFNRLASGALDGPFGVDFGIAPVDSPDGVQIAPYNMDFDAPAGANDHSSVGQATLRYGRLMLSNAYGSELQRLPVPFIAQYFNGAAFIKNVDDNCTQVTVPSGPTALQKNPAGMASSATMNGMLSTGTFLAGDGKLVLSASNLKGFIDIMPTVKDWLKFPWKGGAASAPSSRATFGTYKTGPVIFMRELY